MKAINRLDSYLKKHGISYNAFEKSINASNGYIGKSVKNNSSIGSDVLEKIAEVYPDIDILWLVTGHVSLKKANTPLDNRGFSSESLEKSLIPLSLKRGSASENASPTASPTLKKQKNYTENQPSYVSESGVVYNLGAPHVVTADKDSNDNILYVPVRARAGYLTGYGDAEYISTLPTFRFPGLNNATYRMFEVEGVSMSPTMQNGDRVIGEWVDDLSKIRDNRVHIVVTKNDGVVIKRVLNRINERGVIVLKSDTLTHRADFPSKQIDPSEIVEIWYSRLKISGDFSEPGEIYRRMNDLEGEVVDLRQNQQESSAQLKEVLEFIRRSSK